MRTILVIILALALAPPVQAANGGRPLLPGIIGEDDRTMLDNAAPPWSAIGRVNRARGGFCTGTLVAPDKVLTARHCLTARPGNRYLPLSELHFVAGYRRGDYLAHGRVKGIHAPPLTDADKTADWAVLELDKALPVPPLPLGEPDNGALAVIAGYSQNRPHLLSLSEQCRLQTPDNAPHLRLHRCDTTRGTSGAPVIQTTSNGQPVLVSIVSGFIRTADGAGAGLLVSVEAVEGVD